MARIDRRIGGMMARQNRPDSAIDVAWRRAGAEVKVILDAERAQVFPEITADNAEAVIDWQWARTRDLMKARGF